MSGLVLGSAVLAGPAGAAEPLPEALSRRIAALMAASDVPGLGFGQIRGGKPISAAAFGFADRGRRLPATPDTAFLISSISKVVTGTALMQLRDRRLFALDDPVGPHLDFPAENPRHPGPITFRQVLTHTSSISDGGYEGFGVDGDPKIPLRDFLTGYLSPGGRWFSPGKSYLDAGPGQQWSYSNVAFALAGYLAERIGGGSLKRQSARNIFGPLRMAPAAWSLADLGGAPRATPYVGQNGKLTPRAPIGYPDWPAGLLRTSPRALTRFLAAHAAGGSLEGATVLRTDTVAEMADLKPFPDADGHTHFQGLSWEGGEKGKVVWKSGGDPGSHTLMAFDPATGNGAVVLTNRSPNKALQNDMQELIREAMA
ncbi:serine hydrolase [Phenylobacterium sp.]|uniref:serine hydrolase domain-containing protein n=1 Tax=Phenylobacterium sp. TaxID=1871053 RepID=UPI0011F84AD0|nr:serine hydrolase domain-containing protein [Phenylobacterium sp.]THD57888.1 MAG: class A beta-lactamase-related serine hydrolase [Phenylobacterium sp.]